MNKIVRNALIAAAVAVAVGFVFGFLGAVLHAPGVGSSGQLLAAVLGTMTFFLLHLRSTNRRVATADDAQRQRALSFGCPPGRALVYVARTGFAGKALGVDIDVDGKTVAQIKSPRFTCIELAPGAHVLRAHVGGSEGSSLAPGPATQSVTLADGSVSCWHIGIQRGMVKSQLTFESWPLETARSKLGSMPMVLAEQPSA